MIDKSKVEKIVNHAEDQRFIAALQPEELYLRKGKNPAKVIRNKGYAALVRGIVNQYQYYQNTKDENVEDMVVDASILYEIAEAIEEL